MNLFPDDPPKRKKTPKPSPEVEAIYQMYPRKAGGKPKSYTAIRNALKKVGYARLYKRTKEFAAVMPKKGEPNFEFVPNMPTWFNQERWDEDYKQIGIYKGPTMQSKQNKVWDKERKERADGDNEYLKEQEEKKRAVEWCRNMNATEFAKSKDRVLNECIPPIRRWLEGSNGYPFLCLKIHRLHAVEQLEKPNES